MFILGISLTILFFLPAYAKLSLQASGHEIVIIRTWELILTFLTIP